MRLELLEGAALFYQGALGDAKKKLESAKAKWQRLTVSDEALAQLTLMGFTVKEVLDLLASASFMPRSSCAGALHRPQ